MPLTPIKMLVQIHIVRFQLFLAHEAIKKMLNANFFVAIYTIETH